MKSWEDALQHCRQPYKFDLIDMEVDFEPPESPQRQESQSCVYKNGIKRFKSLQLLQYTVEYDVKYDGVCTSTSILEYLFFFFTNSPA